MLRYLMAYPKKNFSYPGPSMWFSNRINWIISDVQAKNFFLIIFLASNKVLAMLGSWIGTCSVFFSFIFSLTWGVLVVPDIFYLPIILRPFQLCGDVERQPTFFSSRSSSKVVEIHTEQALSSSKHELCSKYSIKKITEKTEPKTDLER